MIRDAVKLLTSGVLGVELWAVALLVNVVGLISTVMLDEAIFPRFGAGLQAVLVLVLFTCVAGIFVTMWKMTRALGLAQDDEQGSVGAWIGWGVLAGLPSILMILALKTDGDVAPPHWWLNSLLISTAGCITVPVIVHATGRAINRDGPTLGAICDYWIKNYGRLFLAYFLASVPLTLVTDGLDAFGRPTQTDAILSTLVSSILYFVSATLGIAIAVIAYREAEAGRPLTAA